MILVIHILDEKTNENVYTQSGTELKLVGVVANGNYLEVIKHSNILQLVETDAMLTFHMT